MKKTRRGMTIGLGVPTVLLIFVVLGMCIVCLLTHLKAQQNQATASKEVEQVTSYYEADSKAQYLIEGIQKQEDMNSFIEENQIEYKDENGMISFSIPMNEKQVLSVVLKENEITSYRVKEAENGN